MNLARLKRDHVWKSLKKELDLTKTKMDRKLINHLGAYATLPHTPKPSHSSTDCVFAYRCIRMCIGVYICLCTRCSGGEANVPSPARPLRYCSTAKRLGHDLNDVQQEVVVSMDWSCCSECGCGHIYGQVLRVL